MDIIVKIFSILGTEMETPVPFGWFHLLWIGIMLVSIFILYKLRNRYSEKQLKIILLVYGVIAFVLEALKQVLWSFNYDSVTNIITWDFQWYSFPFQLCTTPIFVCLISAFLKKGKVRDSLFAYLGFFTILGSISTIFIPDSCFTSDILIMSNHKEENKVYEKFFLGSATPNNEKYLPQLFKDILNQKKSLLKIRKFLCRL